LADYLDSVSDEELISITTCLEDILRSYCLNDRVIIPAIEAIAYLLEEGILTRIEPRYKYNLDNGSF